MDQADDWLFGKLADAYEPENGAAGIPRGLLTVRQVCTLVDVSKNTLYSWIAEEEFPRPKRFGASNIRWLESDVRAWQQARGQGPAP